jgi:hypothetical protein
MSSTCLFRRGYEPAALLAAHPPIFRHPHKQLALDLACPPGAVHGGSIEVTRWAAAPLPDRALAPTVIDAVPGFYDYAGDAAGVWHVNFADPRVFTAYGSALLAQDELQCVEHPLLGSVREALVAAGQASTVDRGPTPVLVRGVERRCQLVGLYGHAFAQASAAALRAAVRPIAPPTITNLIAMAAPPGGRGPYFHDDLAGIAATAFTAFTAAVAESRAAWPGAPVEIRTGFWGCGAFGGNRRAMTALQLHAARLAGVDRVRFHAADSLDDFARGAADLDRALAAGGDVLEQLDDLDYEWGVPDGT